MTDQPTILVVAGSVREKRIGLQIAGWVTAIGRGRVPGAAWDLVDLRTFPLPMDDEPGVPAMGTYHSPHTLAWSRVVKAANAIVFVSPQYNWGYPAPLKNAIDHLYKEWEGKPALIVTYGGHGGGKCAEQLAQVLGAVKTKPCTTRPALVLPKGQVEANTGEIDPPSAFAEHLPEVERGIDELARALRLLH